MNKATDRNLIIGKWLMLGVAMLTVQVLLGGITRLTGSGLSITEWEPILGALPPMNDADWAHAFDEYKKIGQFTYLNSEFTLGDFKFIYFWEWFHRNWARLISVAFLIPFVIFLVKGYFRLGDLPKLLVLFAIGVLLAMVGWIMVFSGLNPEDLYVSHIKLAMHFNLAMFLIALTFWFALGYLKQNLTVVPNIKLRNLTITFIVLLAVQLVYGAFMAGQKAAQAAATWPLINGDLLPPSVLQESILYNSISIHFVHRSLAFVLFIFSIVWTWRLYKSKIKKAFLPITLVLIQALLGILSVLTSPKAVKNGWGLFEWNAQLHQLVAMSLLLSLVYFLFIFSNKKLKYG